MLASIVARVNCGYAPKRSPFDLAPGGTARPVIHLAARLSRCCSSERLGSLIAGLVLFAATGAAAIQPSRSSATLELRLVPSLASADSGPSEVVFAVLHPVSREELVTHAADAGAALAGLKVPVPELATGWVIRARAPGYWSPSVYVPPEETAADVELVRAGRITLHVHSSDVEVDRWEPSDLYVVGRVWSPRSPLETWLLPGTLQTWGAQWGRLWPARHLDRLPLRPWRESKSQCSLRGARSLECAVPDGSGGASRYG